MNFDTNSTFFVTGGTGLLGSHILFNLTEKHKVRALTRNLKKTKRVENLFKYYDPNNYQQRLANIEWKEGDLSDIPFVEECIEGCDFVIHSAGFVSFYKKDFNKLLKENFEGTRNLVNVCLDFKVKKLAYVSSVSTLGKGTNGSPIKEHNRWKNSPENSGYGVSKYLAEREVWRGIEEGLDAVIVNPSIILGPGNLNESSSKIFKAVFKESNFYPPGANSFIDVRDVADATLYLLTSDIKNDNFILNSTSTSYQDIFKKIAKASNKKVPTKPINKGVLNFVYNIELILRIFGRKTMITKENKRSMFSKSSFDGSKILTQTDFKYRKIEDGIENAVSYYQRDH